jgi:hypothetical protein
MGNTKDITKAARALATAERKLAKVAASEDAFIAKAQAKATEKYAAKIVDANIAVRAARKALQDLVAAA